MTEPVPSVPLRLHVHPPRTSLPSGEPVRCLADARGTVALASDATEVHFALPSSTVTESRWILDRLLDRVAGLRRFDSATLTCAQGVPATTATTLGLDLHNRTGGSVEVDDRVQAEVQRVGELESLCRAWVDEDPAARTSLAIARDVEAFAESHADVTTEVLAEPELQELGLRLLLAVGQGSEASPPRLVIARYRPGGKSVAPLMLLGKGITFDTGGINIKPYESFVSMMKNDMAGAATAFALFRGLVESGHDEPITLVLPTCENSVDSRSMRPGAIVRSYRGHTVRIDHTDAEGRLVLADGLAYVGDQDQPRQVLCFATLTTAALISYGPFATPVHFASREFAGAMTSAGDALGEDFHFLPDRIWHHEANRDAEAHLRNTARLAGKADRGAGSRNAAHFLRFFTEYPLCHMDIFASGWNWSGQSPGSGPGATGTPLRTLLRALGA